MYVAKLSQGYPRSLPYLYIRLTLREVPPMIAIISLPQVLPFPRQAACHARELNILTFGDVEAGSNDLPRQRLQAATGTMPVAPKDRG
jgi:hypothetical protein